MGFLNYSICFVIACIASGSVRAAPCSLANIQQCLQGINMDMSDPTKIDMGKVCGILPCIENLDCEMSEEQKAEFTKNYKDVAAACSATGCSVVALQKCFGGSDFANMDKQPTDAEMIRMCPIVECMEKLLPKCEGDMKTQISAFVSAGEKHCKPGCTVFKLGVCHKEMEGIPVGLQGVNSEHCKTLKTASECFKPFVKSCEKDIRENLEQMVIPFADCCNDIMKTKDECFKDESAFENTTFNINQCEDKEESYSCFTKSKLSCEGKVEGLLGEAKDMMRQNLKECQKQGYNLTVSLEQSGDGGNGGMRLNGLLSGPFLLGMILAVVAFWF